MKASIATLRSQLGKLLRTVQAGHELEIQRHNVTIAKIVPIKFRAENRTQLGVGKGSVVINSDLADPFIDESEWHLSDGKFE